MLSLLLQGDVVAELAACALAPPPSESVDAEAVLPADEPPATPTTSVQASPAQQAPAATPTGLGLSTLQPVSPLTAALLAPASTPLAGLPVAALVTGALQAAAQVGHGWSRTICCMPCGCLKQQTTQCRGCQSSRLCQELC